MSSPSLLAWSKNESSCARDIRADGTSLVLMARDAMRLGHVRYRHYVLQERILPFVLERHTAV